MCLSNKAIKRKVNSSNLYLFTLNDLFYVRTPYQLCNKLLSVCKVKNFYCTKRSTEFKSLMYING